MFAGPLLLRLLFAALSSLCPRALQPCILMDQTADKTSNYLELNPYLHYTQLCRDTRVVSAVELHDSCSSGGAHVCQRTRCFYAHSPEELVWPNLCKDHIPGAYFNPGEQIHIFFGQELSAQSQHLIRKYCDSYLQSKQFHRLPLHAVGFLWKYAYNYDDTKIPWCHSLDFGWKDIDRFWRSTLGDKPALSMHLDLLDKHRDPIYVEHLKRRAEMLRSQFYADLKFNHLPDQDKSDWQAHPDMHYLIDKFK